MVTRHAVVFGLVYALVWEALFGSLVPGRAHAERPAVGAGLAQKVADGDLVTSDVGLPTGMVLLVVVTVAATWYAGQGCAR